VASAYITVLLEMSKRSSEHDDSRPCRAGRTRTPRAPSVKDIIPARSVLVAKDRFHGENSLFRCKKSNGNSELSVLFADTKMGRPLE
jgi:hypothetical protein